MILTSALVFPILIKVHTTYISLAIERLPVEMDVDPRGYVLLGGINANFFIDSCLIDHFFTPNV